jgi:hypothetical protein
MTLYFSMIHETQYRGIRVGFGHVVNNEVLDLPFNIGGLISNRNLGQSRQIHQCQIQNPRSVDLQIDWQLGDSLTFSNYSTTHLEIRGNGTYLILPRNPKRLCFDLFTDLIKIRKLSVDMQELGVFCSRVSSHTTSPGSHDSRTCTGVIEIG